MARNNFVATSRAAVALAAAATKTVLTVTSPTGVKVAVKAAMLTFDSSNAAQQAIIVELCRFTAATAGTSTTVTSPSKKNSVDLAPATVVKKDYSVEPTVAEIIMGMEINPAAGVQYPFPINEELIAQNGEIIGIRCTTPSGVTANCYPVLECEE
jgi:hypothetical protein